MVLDNRKVVCIGGGTGMSTMLRGLKEYTDYLTAIVAVSDNGGSSGILRREMNMLPPGDIRNCLLALAETEPIMKEVLDYRFTEGSLEGQNIGNLFLAALNGIYGTFEMAVEKASEVLAVKGTVLPVTTENIQLCAIHNDDSVTEGESEIVIACKQQRKTIKEVYLEPNKPKAYHKAIQAIEEADIIVLGPGSLFTSIIPNLLIEGISYSIIKSKAKKIYISNIMTQPGETDKFSLKNHCDVIEKYLGKDIINYIIVNNQSIDDKILYLYEDDGAEQVKIDLVNSDTLKIIKESLIIISREHKYIRHDHDKLARLIMNI